MADEVRINFTGDASQVEATIARVEERIKAVGAQTEQAQLKVAESAARLNAVYADEGAILSEITAAERAFAVANNELSIAQDKAEKTARLDAAGITSVGEAAQASTSALAAFQAKSQQGQQMSIKYAWAQALIEDAKRTAAAAQTYMADWSAAIIENVARADAASEASFQKSAQRLALMNAGMAANSQQAQSILNLVAAYETLGAATAVQAEAEQAVTEATANLNAVQADEEAVLAEVTAAQEAYNQTVAAAVVAQQLSGEAASAYAAAQKAASAAGVNLTEAQVVQAAALQNTGRASKDAADAARNNATAQVGAASATATAGQTTAAAMGQISGSSRAAAASVADVGARGAAMATSLRTTGVSAKDAASALENLGFSAEQVKQALLDAGYAAEEMGNKAVAAGTKVRGAFYQGRSAGIEFGQVITGAGPASLVSGLGRMAAASSVLGPILAQAFPVIGAIALIDVLAQVPDMIDKMIDKLRGWGTESKRIFSENLKDVQQAITYANEYQLRQAEKAGSGARYQSQGMEAQLEALGKFEGKLAETQKQVLDLKGFLDTADWTHSEIQNLPGFDPNHPIKREVVTANVETQEFKDELAKRVDFYNHYLDDLEKATGQHITHLDPINPQFSDKTTRENIQKTTEMLKALATEMEHMQQSTSERRTDLGPRINKAALDEEYRRFQLAEETKTATLDKATDERIKIAQEEVDFTVRHADLGVEAFLRAQVKLAQVTQQVHAAQLADFKALVQAEIEQDRLSSEAEQNNLRQKFNVALATNAAQSDAVKKSVADIMAAKHNESEDEIGQLTRVLVESVQLRGLQSTEAKKAFDDIVKARRKEVEEESKLLQQLSREVSAAYQDEQAKAAQTAVFKIEQERKAYDAKTKLQMQAAGFEAQGQLGPKKTTNALGILGSLEDLNKQKAMLAAALVQDEAFLKQEEAILQKSIQDRAAMLDSTDPDYPKKKQALEDEKLKIDQKYEADRNALEQKASDQRQKIQEKEAREFQRIEQGMLNAWMSTWDKMLFQAKSFGQAMQSLWTGLVQMIINQMLKMAGEWLITHVIMKAITKIFAKDTGQTDTSQQMATTTAKIQMDAAAAEADVFAQAIAAVPFPANLAVAPAAAAAVAAAMAGFQGQAAVGGAVGSAEGGWDVPADRSSYRAILHPREMVLPEKYASVIRQVGNVGSESRGINSGRGGGADAPGGNHYHAHIHQGDVQAIDGDSVAAFYRKSQRELIQNVHRAINSGRIGAK